MSGKAERAPVVAVLGASGFVGSAVAGELAARGMRVRAVARRSGGDAPPNVERWVADLTDAGALRDAVAGADCIVHTVAFTAEGRAWRVAADDTAAERVNVGLLRDVVHAVYDTGTQPTVVLAAAASQVGRPPAERGDGTESDRPTTAYDRQKLAAEQVLKDATAAGIVRGIALRLPTVYGWGAHSATAGKGVVAAMIRRALAGEPLTMWHDGSVRRDLVFVDDIARAFGAALDKTDRLAGGHWLLGSGRGEPLGTVLGLVAEVVAERTGGPPVPVLSVPPPDYAEPDDFRSVEIDPSAFHTITGWRAEVPLREALVRTVARMAHATTGTTR
jgi:nucleoside-diphosphate-sugar epimerase